MHPGDVQGSQPCADRYVLRPRGKSRKHREGSELERGDTDKWAAKVSAPQVVPRCCRLKRAFHSLQCNPQGPFREGSHHPGHREYRYRRVSSAVEEERQCECEKGMGSRLNRFSMQAYRLGPFASPPHPGTAIKVAPIQARSGGWFNMQVCGVGGGSSGMM